MYKEIYLLNQDLYTTSFYNKLLSIESEEMENRRITFNNIV